MSISATTLRRTLTYQATATAAVLQADLQRIAELDRIAEIESKKFRDRSTLLGVIGFLGGFLTFFLFILWFAEFGMASWFGLLLLCLLAIVVPALIFANKYYQRAQYEARLDVPNHRYRLLGRVVPLLQRDMKPTARLAVNLGLAPPDDRAKFQQQIPHPKRAGWVIDCYADPWLRLRGRLLDGTRFLLTVNQTHQVRSGKNVNGKQRVRPRFKGMELRLSLVCPPSVRQGLPQMAQLERAVQLPPGVILKQIAPTPRGLRLKVKLLEQVAPAFIPSSVEPGRVTLKPEQTNPQMMAQAEQDLEEILYRAIALLFLSAYQILNLARTVAQH